MHKAKRGLILLIGLFETFVFTGNIFGWTALHNLFLQHGVYRHLCEEPCPVNANCTGDTVVYSTKTCDVQDSLLNLAFTVGSFCLGATAIVWGFLLDRWGLRIVRLIINVLLTTGALLLSLTKNETSYLIFPSLVLMCLAGVPLRLANMQIADLFPEQRSTVIALYSGAFTASASVFVFVKYFYDNGLSWGWSCSILIILSVIMLPVTLFLMPSFRFKDPSDSGSSLFSKQKRGGEVAGITPSVWGTYVYVGDLPESNQKENDICGTISNPFEAKEKAPDLSAKVEKAIPLRVSGCSLSFWLHQYWFCWLLLYTIVFVGTLHLWSEQIFQDNNEGVFYAEMYGLLQVTGLILAPLCGSFMDWTIRKASKVQDATQRRLYIIQSNFWPLMATALIALLAQTTQFFFSANALWVAIISVTMFRTLLLSIGTAYLRIRFPAEHFNRLMGIMSTMSALFTLLQFPFFLWMRSKPPGSFIQSNVFNTVCLILTFAHPLLLRVTPLQRRFIKNADNAVASQ